MITRFKAVPRWRCASPCGAPHGGARGPAAPKKPLSSAWQAQASAQAERTPPGLDLIERVEACGGAWTVPAMSSTWKTAVSAVPRLADGVRPGQLPKRNATSPLSRSMRSKNLSPLRNSAFCNVEQISATIMRRVKPLGLGRVILGSP
jgi:hypothetical protein